MYDKLNDWVKKCQTLIEHPELGMTVTEQARLIIKQNGNYCKFKNSVV